MRASSECKSPTYSPDVKFSDKAATHMRHSSVQPLNYAQSVDVKDLFVNNKLIFHSKTPSVDFESKKAVKFLQNKIKSVLDRSS